jgi:hypothetical protein
LRADERESLYGDRHRMSDPAAPDSRASARFARCGTAGAMRSDHRAFRLRAASRGPDRRWVIERSVMLGSERDLRAGQR